ncbi:fibronectin type III and SPRY domain-containing protein 2 [Hoplias malabaricus]|uniref:fibronectin type III and SPRY domain-containing protein 2 n=1 Tax=Hoplias malabaricus TaxID=27720 RepID=UPI0034627773
MDAYEMRGRLQVIAEEMVVSEEEEGDGGGCVEGSFVLVSKKPVSSDPSKHSGEPTQDKTGSLQNTAQKLRNELSENSSRLREKISQMENFAGNLEEIFITVEENFARQEQNLEQHYSEVLQTLSQRNTENSATLMEQKKQKLEALYTKLISCGHMLDISKELIENAQALNRCQNKHAFLQAVMPVIKRIEEFAKEEVELKVGVSMEFVTPTADLSSVKQMMESVNVVPAPSAPVMNPQVVNSASATSLRVCWSLFSDDTVDFYQLYCRQISEDITTETEQDVCVRKVKETHCLVKDLLPNSQYEFWVTATNTTGISPASERAVYMTVPSPPVIKQQECVSCRDAALIRWDSGNTDPVESYTLELSDLENYSNVNESVVAIPTCECVVHLQPWKRYVIHLRAVNTGGASERSVPITISTNGTFFHLLKDTAHPCLSFSADGLTMFYLDEDLPISEMVFSENTFSSCVAVLGDLIPVRGQHYWEVEVDEWAEYRVGVAYEDTQRSSFLGANATSWCMRHILTPSRHKYEFLHNGWSADVRITVQPRRIGILLDYDLGTLSFYNVHLNQHLHTFTHTFKHFVQPCFSLDRPGKLTLHTGLTHTPTHS